MQGVMPTYFSAHTTACLTKQSLRQLMQQLVEDKEITVRRVISSQIAGRMLAESEAPDQAAVEKFFERHLVNCEWIMRVDLDASGGVIKEY
jgi:hypothetical protein